MEAKVIQALSDGPDTAKGLHAEFYSDTFADVAMAVVGLWTQGRLASRWWIEFDEDDGCYRRVKMFMLPEHAWYWKAHTKEMK